MAAETKMRKAQAPVPTTVLARKRGLSSPEAPPQSLPQSVPPEPDEQDAGALFGGEKKESSTSKVQSDQGHLGSIVGKNHKKATAAIPSEHPAAEAALSALSAAEAALSPTSQSEIEKAQADTLRVVCEVSIFSHEA